MVEKKTYGLFVIFFAVMALISALSYQQGKWDGMKGICKEPNIVVGNHEQTEFFCYTEEEYAEVNNVEEDLFDNIVLGGEQWP